MTTLIQDSNEADGGEATAQAAWVAAILATLPPARPKARVWPVALVGAVVLAVGLALFASPSANYTTGSGNALWGVGCMIGGTLAIVLSVIRTHGHSYGKSIAILLGGVASVTVASVALFQIFHLMGVV
jgi:asparagine N-glycosylation enzyme membrane subunit Stt3